MKKFLQEFKEFAITGNMMDLAVGMIVGGAFTSIVKSLVENICMPIISVLTGGIDFSDLFIALNGEHYRTVEEAGEVALIKYGSFITDVINFLIMTMVVFIIIKNINKLREIAKPKEPEVEEAPTEKECPYCFTKISINATRCPHCTSQLSE